jgi:hypothetical protein
LKIFRRASFEATEVKNVLIDAAGADIEISACQLRQ